MVKYAITYGLLCEQVTQLCPTWLGRAKRRTDNFIINGEYAEKSSIWNEIKVVYMTLQYHKCAFCERQLEGVEIGKIEMDVEHFRPKGLIRAWSSCDSDITITPAPQTGGYFALPYHLFNYSASCKPCNSVLKKDYFPLAANYQFDGKDPSLLNPVEQPYLIYPIGDVDTDPYQLIRFNGISPYAASADPHQKKRALITIEFFKLDDPVQRKNLLKERAMVLVAVWTFLNAQSNEAQKIIEEYRSTSTRPHTNCGRCFIELFETDKAQAALIFDRSIGFLASSS